MNLKISLNYWKRPKQLKHCLYVLLAAKKKAIIVPFRKDIVKDSSVLTSTAAGITGAATASKGDLFTSRKECVSV